MKILIIEAYSAANIGSGALVENSVRLLLENFPGAEIEILAQTPESIHKLTGIPTYHELITLPLAQSRPKQVLWLLSTGLWMAVHALAMQLRHLGLTIPEGLYTFNARTLTAVRKVREADMVVSVGAERINDNFYKAILFSLYMLWMVHSYGKFLVLFPQTIGPFHFRITRYFSGLVLNRCHVVFLRDLESVRYIRELGVSGPDVTNTCDVAVLQPPVAPEAARALLASAGIPDDGRPLVGISVMQWTYIKAEGSSGYEEYKRAVAAVADRFIVEKGARVLFIATNVPTQGCREDDVAAARDIMRLMRHTEGAAILGRVYTPGQMKGILGLCELCLVTRMHACIFSTGMLTPTVSINYQFKLKEYMKLMGLGEYTVDIDKVTDKNLSDLMERAWVHRAKSHEILREKITSWAENLKSEMARLPDCIEAKRRIRGISILNSQKH